MIYSHRRKIRTMRIKRIFLENIRSYERQEIVFPEGSTLLSGDIGSGKTSILLAIEFALFGLQPGQRGNSLLRNGRDNGRVKLNFEIDGQEIIIERTLKRGKSVSQDTCSISIDGEKKEVSVTELKSKVLDLLKYPKEFSKKQNILYKFTVYTPQEEMKQIILQDSVTRINTLRHVFGIDKYKKILENISVIASKLREEKRLKEGMIMSLDQDKIEIETKEIELETKNYNLVSVEKDFFLKKNQRKKIEEEKNIISEKIRERDNLKKEIEKTKIMVSTKANLISDNKTKIKLIENQINELTKLDFDESRIGIIEEEILNLKKEKEEINKKNIEIYSLINSLNSKNQDNDKIKDKLTHIEVCPTCLQDVNLEYKNNVIKRLEDERERNSKKLEKLNFEKENNLMKIAEINESILLNEKSLDDLKTLKIKFENINEKKEQIIEIEKSNEYLEKDIEMLNKHIDSLKSSILELDKYENIFEEKQKEYQIFLKEERDAEIKVAELKKDIQLFSIQIKELKEKVERTEQIKKSLDYISELESWMTSQFATIISSIEKNVMIALKREFSNLFSEWFNLLVSDSFNVHLDDDFTPIIEQQDYELDYSYLSGGERTAIALAYRLSLNQVINSLMSKIKTKDLVILDEPTDGFSEQQLDKMREVLEQLDVKQLIIVSHEKKIENFVEHVIKLKKEGGVSGKSEKF